jgi:hypothetical protein
VDRREDPHRSATVRALEHVDREDAAHELGPGEPPGSARGQRLDGRCGVREPFGIVRGVEEGGSGPTGGWTAGVACGTGWRGAGEPPALGSSGSSFCAPRRAAAT